MLLIRGIRRVMKGVMTDLRADTHTPAAMQADRLATADLRRIGAAHVAQREHFYAQYTFAPRLNERSRQLAEVQEAGASLM